MTTVQILTTRIDRIEELLAESQHAAARRDRHLELLEHLVEQTQRQVEQTQRQVDRLTQEMSDFKQEMSDFKQEMSDFKQEMSDFKQEMREDRKQLRRELANISYSMGRMVEDLVAPSMPGILAQIIGCVGEPQMQGVRMRKQASGRSKEYDVIAICGEYLMITEVKTRLHAGDIADFRTTLQEARTFLPEYAEKQIIGALATFYVDETQVRYAERQGLVVLGVIDGLMQVLNQHDFRPTPF